MCLICCKRLMVVMWAQLQIALMKESSRSNAALWQCRQGGFVVKQVLGWGLVFCHVFVNNQLSCESHIACALNHFE